MEISASSITSTPFHALIPAAGSGTRLGGERPKQYQKIAGKAILRHTLERFLDCDGLQNLQVIISPEHTPLYLEAVDGLDLPPYIAGGESRKSSVYNGLKAFSNIKDDHIVLIHDAARPFISTDEIAAITDAAAEKGASTAASRVTDTQRYLDGDYVSRDNLWALQTPQAFHYDLIMQAHQKFENDDTYTDDTALVQALGTNVQLIECSRYNIKITTQEDLDLAKLLLRKRPKEKKSGKFELLQKNHSSKEYGT